MPPAAVGPAVGPAAGPSGPPVGLPSGPGSTPPSGPSTDATAAHGRVPLDPGQPLLFSKIQWLILLRLGLATCLFGVTLWIQVRGNAIPLQLSLLYGLAVALYLVSGVFAALMKVIRRLEALAYVQLVLDVISITPVVYLTGGLDSIFSFLYFWVIISASYLLYTPGGFYAAAFSGLCYAGLVTVQVRGILPSFADNQVATSDISYVFYNVTINVFAFFLVAFLSSYLAEQIKRTKEALLEEQSNLRELEELNRKIVENISSGLITVSTGGTITYLNRAAEVILGQSRSELLGTTIEEVFPGTANTLREILPDENALLQPVRWERLLTRKDQQKFTLGFSSSPLRSPEGAVVGAILIFEDLTRIRRLEEKARRDDRLKAVGRMAAGMAHEIRNPLASISGSIQVLQGELELHDENRVLMDIVVRETDRLNELLTDFLRYVRPTRPERREVDLARMIREIFETLKHHPRCHPQLQLLVDMQHTRPLTADPSQIRQVIWNLALNAVEVMPDGGELRISTRDLLGNGEEPDRLSLRVQDTGPGIEPSIAERIFDPFFSTKPGGTGLGLALVEKLVQAHDGTIRAQPLPSGGVAFDVVFPTRSAIPVDDQELTPDIPLSFEEVHRAFTAGLTAADEITGGLGDPDPS